MNNRRRGSSFWLPITMFVLFPASAMAHPGIGGTSGLLCGLAHPLSGFDHLIAMLGIGVWSAQRGGRSLWILPNTFLAAMAVGGLLGAGRAALPVVEFGVVASVLVCGALILAESRMSLNAAVLLVALVACLHGHAHGSELPPTASGLTYGIGFLASSLMLELCGLAAALGARRCAAAAAIRWSGAAIVSCGLLLALTRVA
jgi:urease accessory protein